MKAELCAATLLTGALAFPAIARGNSVVLPPAQISGTSPCCSWTNLTAYASGFVGLDNIVQNPVVAPILNGKVTTSAVAPYIEPAYSDVSNYDEAVDDPMGAYASVSATSVYDDNPRGVQSLAMTATISVLGFNGPGADVEAQVELTYKFKVGGPSPTVQAQFIANGAASAGGEASVTVSVPDGAATLLQDIACVACNEYSPTSFAEGGM